MSRLIAASMLTLSLALGASSMAEAKTASHASVAMNGPAKVLTDSNGRSLYIFDKDQPGRSECTLLCAVAWPPFIAPAGAKAHGQWSLVQRPTGVTQWAYHGSPLYTYRFDVKRGDVRGDGAEGTWHVARP